MRCASPVAHKLGEFRVGHSSTDVEPELCRDHVNAKSALGDRFGFETPDEHASELRGDRLARIALEAFERRESALDFRLNLGVFDFGDRVAGVDLLVEHSESVSSAVAL